MKTHNDSTNTIIKQRHIVFVHGIFNTGRVFALMVRDAHKHGFIPHAPSLKRADGRATMRELAEQVKMLIDTEIPQEAEVSVIGFSMGGVVARVYVQMLGGRERIRSLVTIGSPHRGSWWAYCNPFAGSKELRPGSELLSALAESEGTLGALPLLAIHSPLDTSIIPYTSGIWARAMNKRFWGQFHPFMPYSRGVRSAVWEFLQHHGV